MDINDELGTSPEYLPAHLLDLWLMWEDLDSQRQYIALGLDGKLFPQAIGVMPTEAYLRVFKVRCPSRCLALLMHMDRIWRNGYLQYKLN